MSVDTIERNYHEANEWVNELCRELGTNDEALAWRVLRADLQVLRDRLTIDEGAQLAAQLPHMLRGVFYEGFDPGHQPQKIRHADDFLHRIAERAELPDVTGAQPAAAAATRVLRRHITEGEFEDVMAQLPEEVRAALDDESGPVLG
jgi:uncharacterized protein (DUF2267 family)